ncbi:MAG TPA: DUF2723 domain-containing protein [Candidatus Eisenbacteria bacterium]|nr:DUF2723 domain-containing protein [Candidatus Eisenbacteria bacterium]
MPRLSHGAAWVAALVALWVYAQTLSPTVAWVNQGEDSGDLLAASATLGIPHPTGYPLFVLLGRLASLLPLGSIAFRINLVAALAGAAGVFFLARFVLEQLAADRDAAAAESPRESSWPSLLAAGSALLYALSRGAWGQSVLAEVYTLNVAFLGAILWALARFERRRDVRWLLLASFLWGVGLTNHLLLLAAAPAIAWSAGRALATKRIGATTCVLALLLAGWGATLVLYLPIRAGVGLGPGGPPGAGPEFSWGVPATPAQLQWVLTGAQYQRNFFARDLGGALAHLVPGRWWPEFGWGLLALAGGVAAAAAGRLRRLGPATAAFAAAIALFSCYAIADDVGYWMPVAWLAAAIAGVGAARLASSGGTAARATAGVLLLLVLGGAVEGYLANRKAVDASKDLTPYLYAQRNLSAVEGDALIVSEYDGRTFALWFYKATEFRRTHPRLVVAYKYLLVWPWYLHHLARVYPWVRVPGHRGDLDDTMNVLIARNLDKHPVYLTRLDPGLAPVFRAEPVGYPPIPLYRVRWAKP